MQEKRLYMFTTDAKLWKILGLQLVESMHMKPMATEDPL